MLRQAYGKLGNSVNSGLRVFIEALISCKQIKKLVAENHSITRRRQFLEN
jgi:hypothetical protein